MPLRLAFFGTPAFAAASFERLCDSPHTVVAAVTQPDRPRGRGHHVQPEAVKRAALARGVPVFQPVRLGDATDEWRRAFDALQPDLAVVAAYGRLLPQGLLDVPRLGVINVHASLLPRWRGAAPVHRAVMAGDAITGVTIMRVVLALDAGPMIAHASTPIGPEETSADLEARLASMGATLVADTVDQLARGAVPEREQDASLATYAARLSRADSRIDWTRSAADIHNQIRGLHPWPLAGGVLNGRRVMLLRSAVDRDAAGAPGQIVAVTREGFVVAAGVGGVRVVVVQEAGRAPMPVADYLNGRRIQAGDRVEPLPDPAP